MCWMYAKARTEFTLITPLSATFSSACIFGFQYTAYSVDILQCIASESWKAFESLHTAMFLKACTARCGCLQWRGDPLSWYQGNRPSLGQREEAHPWFHWAVRMFWREQPDTSHRRQKRTLWNIFSALWNPWVRLFCRHKGTRLATVYFNLLQWFVRRYNTSSSC